MVLLSFALFFLSDWNDWRWGRRGLRLCFPAGAALLALSLVLLCRRGEPPAQGGARWALWAGAAVFALLLGDALLTALRPRDAYGRPGESRAVCTAGPYALCRHPGVLWLAGLTLCLRGAAGLPLRAAALITALNVLLVWFEDACVFPARLEGYGAYRRSVPFLIPNPHSIRACLRGGRP